MTARAAKALLAQAAVLLVVAVAAADDPVACQVTELDGSTITLYPGRFDPAAAAAALEEQQQQADLSNSGSDASMNMTGSGQQCPDPQEVPADSAYPFWLGTATAAYQIEGAAAEGGRGPSIWDVFAHTPGKTANGDTGDVADDFFHKFEEDIALMQTLGLRNFRLSLSWSRLLPQGTGEVNQEGVDFYNRVINALLAACIQPHVTLYHWDLPQPLYEQYGGWINERVVQDFGAYAETAFGLFGDRVKHWYTLNEVETYCQLGYGSGTHAPGRCSDRGRCPDGNSDTEPHLCAYYSVLAHATAVKAFRRLVPDGKIGITTAIGSAVPFTNSTEDMAAADRQQAFNAGFALDPIYTGDWTPERWAVYGALLPAFTPEQKDLLLQNKQDFIALQHYTGAWAKYDPNGGVLQTANTITSATGYTLPMAESTWLFVFPEGLRHLLVFLSKRYPGVDILITENGVSAPGESSKPVTEALCDTFRISYYREYIGNATEAATMDGVPLKGYFSWSLLDNFEWADGYNMRFGIVYVDFAAPTRDRYYKASSMWLSQRFGLPGATQPPGSTTS